MLPWQPDDMTHLSYEQHEDDAIFTAVCLFFLQKNELHKPTEFNNQQAFWSDYILKVLLYVITIYNNWENVDVNDFF